MDYIQKNTPVSNAAGAGNGLTMGQAIRLEIALKMELTCQTLRAISDKIEAQRAEDAAKPGKKMGVWVDGKLRFQSRDHDEIYAYAERQMADVHRRNVWVAPVGSFVDTPARELGPDGRDK